MALSSAHTCTLQSIIHEDGSLQKQRAVRSENGRNYDELGRRGAPEETGTLCLCPRNGRAGQQREGLRNYWEADAGGVAGEYEQSLVFPNGFGWLEDLLDWWRVA
jgi:hypothetical protein